jgi:hypothetical protein
MTWFNLLKQPKLRTSSNITTQLGTSVKEDDDCRRKYQEYINKIESMSGPHMQVKVDNYRLEDFTEEELCAILKDISMIDKNKMVYTQQGYSANVFNKAHSIERITDEYPNGYVELRHRLVTEKFYHRFMDLMYKNSVDFMWLYTGGKRSGGDFPPETSVVISVDVAKLSSGSHWFNEDVNKAISMVDFR